MPPSFPDPRSMGAGGTSNPYYFCLNPNVQRVTDLCGDAYTDAMRHDEGITSFRCVAPQRPCLADGPVHVAVSTPRFATEWFSSAALEPPLAEGNCTAHADCDDGDACTSDSCAEGCCHHTPTADCLTDAEGYKAPADGSSAGRTRGGGGEGC